MSTETITVRLTPGEVARVDEMRGEGVSRSAFVRELLRRAGPVDEAPTYGEALELLARRARAGKVQAQVALERPSDAGGVVRGRLLTVRARAAMLAKTPYGYRPSRRQHRAVCRLIKRAAAPTPPPQPGPTPEPCGWPEGLFGGCD